MLLKLNRRCVITLIILVASASLILLTANACAWQGKDSLPSQGQKAKRNTPAKIQLNEDEIGLSSDTSTLSKKLEDTFKMRKEQRAYKRGMERRVDLSEGERIEKTVFVKAERSIDLEDLTRVIEAFENAGAEPVLLPITVDEAKVRKIKPNRVRLCSVCALARDRWTDGEEYPNPLTLLVRLWEPNSKPPLDASGLPSMSDFLISDGIPIVRSNAGRGDTVAVITIPRDGEYTLGEKRIEKAALEKEIRDRIIANPQTEKAIAIKCNPDITYGSLEDIYYAAFAAGAKRIVLDTGEKTISWEDQGMRFVLPAGWRRDTFLVSAVDIFRLKGPDDARLSVDVLDKREPDDVERALKIAYEFQLGRQQKGENEEVRYLELDGAKGLLVRDVSEEGYRGRRSMNLLWQGYRQIRGKQQFVSISASVALDSFNKRREELYGILSSIKLTQN